MEDITPRYLFYTNEEAGIFIPHNKTPVVDKEERKQLCTLIGEVREAISAFLPSVNLQTHYDEAGEFYVDLETSKVQTRIYYLDNGWVFFYVWDEELGEVRTEDPGIRGMVGVTYHEIKTRWKPQRGSTEHDI